MSVRLASIDANLADMLQSSHEVDKRTSEMSIGRSEIKCMVGDHGQSINNYRDELSDVKKVVKRQLSESRPSVGMIESIQIDITEPATGLM